MCCVVIQSLSRVQLFATPWTEAHQASLSFTMSQSLLKLLSIESVIPSNHFICRPLLLLPFPASGSFPMSWLFATGGQSIGTSASVSVLPKCAVNWEGAPGAGAPGEGKTGQEAGEWFLPPITVHWRNSKGSYFKHTHIDSGPVLTPLLLCPL